MAFKLTRILAAMAFVACIVLMPRESEARAAAVSKGKGN
jgi:hypothetical protein